MVGNENLISFPLLEEIYKDKSKLINILQNYISQNEKDFIELKDAIEQSNYTKIKDTAHKMKGSAKYLELQKIVNILQKIENYALEKNIDQIKENLIKLSEELKHTYDKINEYIIKT
ncbi:Hpt domain-containing protein [Deferribacter autotrophicus]|uniref:Hpt domain-containing protein n=1 Tax=Deferribacter autotrophicus TaxID=500465 RepID=A0A5A8F447_9BACT|nr:Hpt domain-containing protein [Deferribacter autotrophicus]KAA0258231.1 Hpt domain-containing protein [Deferribacter autotrophicus]